MLASNEYTRRRRPYRTESISERTAVEQMVFLCLGLLSELSTSDVASRTGLSLNTIYNLIHGRYSSRIQTRTLSRLANAAGVELNLVSGTIALKQEKAG